MPTANALLTGADEVALAKQIEAGLLAGQALAAADFRLGTAEELLVVERQGRQAWQRFLTANLRLVQMVAHQEARRTCLPSDELVQEGFLGLATALQRWDYRRGLRFSTFAMFWVRQYVADAAATRCGWLEMSGKTAMRARRLRAREARLVQERGRPVAPAEVAESVGEPLARVEQLLAHAKVTPLEVDVPLEPSDEPHPALAALLAAMGRLPRVERHVLRLRLGFATGQPVSQHAVADRLGVSLSTVRRTEQRGLARLRTMAAGAASVA